MSKKNYKADKWWASCGFDDMEKVSGFCQDEYKEKYNIDVTYPSLTIANFTLKQDRYLYWHCPLDFVREYLHEQCGYKDNWFVKLFWRK